MKDTLIEEEESNCRRFIRTAMSYPGVCVYGTCFDTSELTQVMPSYDRKAPNARACYANAEYYLCVMS